MKVFELRAYLKERGIRGYSTIKKQELQEKVQKIREKEDKAKYDQALREAVKCKACSEQQRIQRKIDERTHNQRLLESTLRTLVCAYCQHANFIYDGDETTCADCGVVQDSHIDINSRRFR